MSLNITEGTVPEVTQNRTREENPFDGMFPTEGHGTPEQKSLVVDLPSDTEEERKYVNKVASQAQAAARETKDEKHPNGYSARVKRDEIQIGSGKSKKPGTRLTIWSVERITRERKPADTAATE